MTTLVLATITLFAAAVLVGVMWSLVAAMRAESANARLRREGVRATGTVLDNTMAVMAVTMVVTYQVWDQFRHDKGSPPQPAATQPAVAPVPE